MTSDGKPVEFIARPDEVVNRDADVVYARPDDADGEGLTWRARLLEHNTRPSKSGTFNLLPAYQLYKPEIYRRLVNVFGLDNVYILSAGWGLVRASFALPKYDITFNTSADRYKKRGKRDEYADFNHLAGDSSDDLMFFGGNDYSSLFYELTKGYKGRRIVFHCSDAIDRHGEIEYKRYRKCFTNWHYACAESVADRFSSNPRDFEPLAVTW